MGTAYGTELISTLYSTCLVGINTWKRNSDGPSPLTRHGYVMYRYVTSWQNINTCHHCGKCPVAWKFPLLGTRIRTWAAWTWTRTRNLQPAGLGLESCLVWLGLDSRHAGLGLDSDSRKRGFVATLRVDIKENSEYSCLDGWWSDMMEWYRRKLDFNFGNKPLAVFGK